jgi:hypothetical protein
MSPRFRMARRDSDTTVKREIHLAGLWRLMFKLLIRSAAMFGFGTKDKKPTQAEAYRELKQSLDEAIIVARRAGVWPENIADLLSAHLVSLNRGSLQRHDRQW